MPGRYGTFRQTPTITYWEIKRYSLIVLFLSQVATEGKFACTFVLAASYKKGSSTTSVRSDTTSIEIIPWVLPRQQTPLARPGARQGLNMKRCPRTYECAPEVLKSCKSSIQARIWCQSSHVAMACVSPTIRYTASMWYTTHKYHDTMLFLLHEAALGLGLPHRRTQNTATVPFINAVISALQNADVPVPAHVGLHSPTWLLCLKFWGSIHV